VVCEVEQFIKRGLFKKAFQAVSEADGGLRASGIEGDQDAVVILSPAAVPGEVGSVEQPERVHAEGVVAWEMVDDHLQDYLGETPLDLEDFLLERCLSSGRKQGRRVSDGLNQARDGPGEDAGPGESQPTAWAFSGGGGEGGEAVRALHARA
jgi:hypothetical protein